MMAVSLRRGWLTTAADSGVDVAEVDEVDVGLVDKLEIVDNEEGEDVDVVKEVVEDDENVVVDDAKACVSCG